MASTSDNEKSKKKKDTKVDDLNNEKDDKKKDSEINEQNSTRTRKRTHKQKTRLLPQKNVYKSAQQLDFTYNIFLYYI